MNDPLLEIDDLRVDFDTRAGLVQAVRGVSLTLGRGETLGLVGESGSGKSVTAQAVMGLIDVPGRIAGGAVRWNGMPLVGEGVRRRPRRIWGREITMIFQNPMTSLNPLMTVGAQLGEVIHLYLGLRGAAARTRAAELLDAVGISGASRRLDQYPHEFSGGMRQRVMIAMAIASEPRLLIADEPTTALDVTIQAQILELLAGLQEKLGLSIILITHDLGIVAGLCHRVAVMYAGQIVETGTVDDIFARPGHPYTQGLIRSTPRLDAVEDRLVSIDGTPPGLRTPPEGCAFRPRCPAAQAACHAPQRLASHGAGHVACCRAGVDAWDVGAA
ncbi:ABC transporter ATP-binding protein [Allosediminivita pacifica]|uniref:Peptide/nickel transport system ATP-binding protein n=1 Tax=Allosediminivita pacifica TaxID=1267769 RepID=A0A2T6AS87_9RHOB|nr:ABC transporter ATP-binding protein [Allosediminivita pacifica]PTX46684.1 peptide/nickel transport system ATP-binding protein [Allosediminivita pacifica]GGB16041.1 ABC transporter ATP-binding protein [Allosediminivita pacifica]